MSHFQIARNQSINTVSFFLLLKQWIMPRITSECSVIRCNRAFVWAGTTGTGAPIFTRVRELEEGIQGCITTSATHVCFSREGSVHVETCVGLLMANTRPGFTLLITGLRDADMVQTELEDCVSLHTQMKSFDSLAGLENSTS